MQIVQYINLIKSDQEPGEYGSSFITSEGGTFPWLGASDFAKDDVIGHGTHTAGSVAGAALGIPSETVTCLGSDVLGCVGGCISTTASNDDLLNAEEQASYIDLDRLCPSFDCGEYPEEICLGDDVDETIIEHGGMAQGAKLAIFDVFYNDTGLGSFAGNGVWEACLEAGCKIHSNSYGGDNLCEMRETDVEYDDFMYNVGSLRLLISSTP